MVLGIILAAAVGAAILSHEKKWKIIVGGVAIASVFALATYLIVTQPTGAKTNG